MNRSPVFTLWSPVLGLLIIIFGLSQPSAALASSSDLAGSGQHSLAIQAGQPFGYAWGANQAGQLGLDSGGETRPYPFVWSPAGIGTAWTQVASGDWHSVALAADGTVWTWGQNGQGQLGNGTTVDHPTPAPVSGLRHAIAVAAGKYHSLAVTDDGQVWGWGNNDYRQLGNNGSQGLKVLTPVPVVVHIPGTATRPDQFLPLTDVIAVAASEVHSVALKKDGTVWAWGDNSSGQLGTCNTFTTATAKPVLRCGTDGATSAPLSGVQAISAGGYWRSGGYTEQRGVAYTLAVMDDGTVWGWGNNESCQLGESASEPPTPPQPLPNLNRLGTLRALAGGDAHGAALTVAGQVWTWGDNTHGQLGDGTVTTHCTPLLVPTLTDVATLGAGPAHTLVTTREGRVWAWGRNDLGQLGDGGLQDRGTPEPVRDVCGVGNLNLQAEPPAGCPVAVATSGVGSGTVAGAGDYAAGATVTLTATPADGSALAGWSPSPCAAQFTMPNPARALTCTAKFTNTVIYPVTLATTGQGSGTVDGGGAYAAGEPVALTAKPNPRSQFTGWSPAPCAAQFTMPDQSLTCTATFDENPIVPLTVVTAGEGQGTVSGSGQYQAGEIVTLTATPQWDRDHFAGWSPSPCAAVFTMPEQPLTCTATFTAGATAPGVSEHIWNYYEQIIGRTSTTAEQTTWENDLARIQTLGIDVAEGFRTLIRQLFTSAEYQARDRSDTQYLGDLYRILLGRDLNAEELAKWPEQLAAGLPRDLVLSEVLFSAEFTAYLERQFGTATSRAEGVTVMDFYRGFLNRLPDSAGFRYWLDRFQTAQCQGAAAVTAEVEAMSSQFANTEEYRNRQRTHQEYVQDLYSTFLRRGADVEGFNYWLNRLETGELNREQVRQFFVGTPEFQGRVTQILQQGCIRVTFTQVSAGSNHTCGVKIDGTIACWGSDSDGKSTPPTGSFTQVSADLNHTCGVKIDGTIACWGDNKYGQATPPAGTFTQLDAGNYHTCGVKIDGTIACWGDNDDGQATPPAGTFTQVSAGWRHTCGVRTDGTVACWGFDSDGKNTPPAGTFTQVSASSDHTCGVKIDGTVACWGDRNRTTPPAGTFTQVSERFVHTCGVKTDGTIACWGNNKYGQATPPAGTFTQLDAGSYHTCGVKIDGTIACWGDNDDGQATPPVPGSRYVLLHIQRVGFGQVTSEPAGIVCESACQANFPLNTTVTLTAIPDEDQSFSHWNGACSGSTPNCQVAMSNTQQQVQAVFSNATMLHYRQVSAGGVHTCGVKTDGTVACWGNDWFGQATPPAGTFTQLDAGNYHTCGVKIDGTIACWGSNDLLGNFVGQAIPPDGTFTQVSAGHLHTCGVRTDGTVACWGSNDVGQAIPPDGTFTQVSASGDHTCGVKTDGTVACWGEDGFGEATPPAGTFTQLDAGYNYTCGVKIDGTIACWGYKGNGGAMPPAGTFTQVSVLFGHTCGIKTDGTVACWGNNDDGQASRPAGTFTQVSAGGHHTCGVTTNESVVCWGGKDHGQSTPPEGSASGATVGVFRVGSWFLDANGNGAWDGCDVDRCYTGNFGAAGDLPVAGRW